VKKSAFTLAEVLITLGIIGIVAAITIPILVNNSQKNQYVTGVQKVYAVLNQAFAKYASDNGCVGNLACTGLFSATVPNNVAMWDDFVTNYLKVGKNCSTTTNQDCFASSYNFLHYPGGGSGGNPENPSASSYKIVLQDGMSVSFNTGGTNCTDYPTFGGSGGICGGIEVDVNGKSAPNTYGRDYQFFNITKTKGLMTWYGSAAYAAADICGGPSCSWKYATGSDPNMTCSMSLVSVGDGCAARIIEEGWQMNY
jgi:prepilin-type N-terminal cleavage/methylation domain-containing protein